MGKIHFLKEGEVTRKKNYVPASQQYKLLLEELLDDALEQQDLIEDLKKKPLEKIKETITVFFEKPGPVPEPPILSPIILNEEKSKELVKANERIEKMYKIHEERLEKLHREYQSKSTVFQRHQEKLIYQMFFWKLFALFQFAGIFGFLMWAM